MSVYLHARGWTRRNVAITPKEGRRGYYGTPWTEVSVDNVGRGREPREGTPRRLNYRLVMGRFFGDGAQTEEEFLNQFRESNLAKYLTENRYVGFQGRLMATPRISNNERPYADLVVFTTNWEFLDQPIESTARQFLEALAEKGSISREEIPEHINTIRTAQDRARADRRSGSSREDRETPVNDDTPSNTPPDSDVPF